VTAPAPIVFNSPEYASWHEAGHVEAALRCGAEIVAVNLYRDNARSYGRTRVVRDERQADEIGLGGFGVEYLLYMQDRLRKEDGSVPTEKEFIDFAVRNATDDYTAYWARHPEAGAAMSESERDLYFMNEAIGRAKRSVDIDLVERIAMALLAADHLDGAGVMAALA